MFVSLPEYRRDSKDAKIILVVLDDSFGYK